MISSGIVRFGLIGAGRIAQTYVQALSGSHRATLAGVADLRPEAVEATARAARCRSFSSHSELASTAKPDAAIVCTPPNTHAEISIWLLERGIHVLCEKPLAVDVASAERMLEAARRGGTTLTMASKFRYVEDVERAKAIVASGTLGDIVLFENSFTGRVDMSSRWHCDPRVSGGGVFIDNGSHSVDILRYFLGPLDEIQVVELKRIQKLPVEDTVRVFVRAANGVVGSIDLSWSISKEQPNYISIYGSHGALHVGWKESKYRRSSDDEWIVFGSGYDKTQAFRSQIENFSAAICGEEQLRITSEDAMASVEVIEAAYRSLRKPSWQYVNGDCRRACNGGPRKDSAAKEIS